MNDHNGIPVLSRRDLIKLLIGSGVSVAAALVLADPLDPLMRQVVAALQPKDEHTEPTGPRHPHWGMVIDLSKCIGCEYCVYACQATNDVPDDMRWNIHLVDQTPTGQTFHVTRPCLHCQHAPCVSVCPVTATYYREDGLVMMDYGKCIGCRYCQAACPYGARVFNWTDRGDTPNERIPAWGTPEVERRPRGVVEKCTFCVHRIDAGYARHLTPGIDPDATPACVNICPVRARTFGNLNDPDSEVSRIIASTPTFRLREDLGTDASVYYIPPEGMTI
jgi:Fe-S-cluster-containing dehydrogenase component